MQSVTSGGMTNSYTYSDDRLTDINVNGGTRYQFTYDAFGRTTYTKVGNGLAYRNLSQLIYNGNGLLSRQNYGNGDYITFSYDSLDRLIGKSYNGSSTDKVEYFYGADGNISKTIDYSTNTRTKYVYDLAGRLVSTRDYKNDKSDNEGLKAFVEYTYADKTNYLTGIKHYNALGTQNIGYRYGDIANGEMPDQIYGVTWNGEEKVNYTYDSLGRLTNKVVGGNIPQPLNTTYTYVDVDDTKTTTLLSSMTTEWLTYNYTYDELGNITSIDINEDDFSSYEYDALNQLIRSGDRLQNKTFTYEYVNGNIKYVHEYDYTTGTLPETPLKTTEYHYDDEVWSDVLTGVSQYSYNTSNASTYGLRNNSSSSIEEYARSILGDDLGDYEIVDFGSKALLSPQSESSGASTYSLPRSTYLNFTYSVESDEIGNITNIDGIEIEWNGRRAERVQKGDNTITYEYNIDGQRVSKTVNGVKTEYFYNGSILAGQKTVNDTVIFMYDNNGDIFGFNYNGEEYYYVKNAQNDVVLILNGDRTAAVIYMYDAWGNITGALDLSTDKISNINPITYRSYYYDIEMGVYYLNSRYYAPVICRFMSGDSAIGQMGNIQGHNMFSYAFNNPLKYSDPSGNWPSLSTVFTVVAVAAVVVAAVAVCVATAGLATVAVAGGGTALVATATTTTALGVAATAAKVASIATTAAAASALVETHVNNKKSSNNHSVYVLKDVNDTVQYVGRTTNVSARESAHKINPARSDLTLEVLHENISYAEARGLEQTYMSFYHTINTANKMNNQINGIGLMNPNLGTYLTAAEGVLGYAWNQVSNEVLYWAGL